MNRLGQGGAHAQHGPIFVGSGAQMGDGAQEFVGMAFLLQRIDFRVSRAEQRQGARPHFKPLSLGRRNSQLAANVHRRARAQPQEQVVARRIGIHDRLQVREAGTVIDFQKRKALGVPAGANPAHDANVGTGTVAAKGRFHGSASYAHASFQVKVKGQQDAPEAMVSGRYRCSFGL